MKFIKYILATIIIISFTSCIQLNTYQYFIDKEALTFTQQQIDNLKNSKYDEIISNLHKSQLNDSIKQSFITMSNYFPADSVINVNIVGFRVMNNVTEITYGYEYKDRILVIPITVVNNTGKYSILGFYVLFNDINTIHANEFTILNKPFKSIAFLILSFTPLIVTFFALYKCIVSKIYHKWLWLIIITIGIFSLSINWTTNEFYFQLFHIRLFNFSCTQAYMSPLIISMSFPIGALLFLYVRQNLILKRIYVEQQKANPL